MLWPMSSSRRSSRALSRRSHNLESERRSTSLALGGLWAASAAAWPSRWTSGEAGTTVGPGQTGWTSLGAGLSNWGFAERLWREFAEVGRAVGAPRGKTGLGMRDPKAWGCARGLGGPGDFVATVIRRATGRSGPSGAIRGRGTVPKRSSDGAGPGSGGSSGWSLSGASPGGRMLVLARAMRRLFEFAISREEKSMGCKKVLDLAY